MINIGPKVQTDGKDGYVSVAKALDMAVLAFVIAFIATRMVILGPAWWMR